MPDPPSEVDNRPFTVNSQPLDESHLRGDMEQPENVGSGRRTRSIDGAEALTHMLAGDRDTLMHNRDTLMQPEGNPLADDETPDEAGSTNIAAAIDFAVVPVPWIRAGRTPVPTHENPDAEVVEVAIVDEDEEVEVEVQVLVEDDDEMEVRERAREADEADMELVERELVGAMDYASMLEDDSHRVARPGVTVIDRWSFFRMLFAVHRNLTASFPELVMWGQVFLRSDYRICIYHRAVEDSLRWVIWDPDAPVPYDFYALRGLSGCEAFALAHSLPEYLQGWRMTRATLGNRVPGEIVITTEPRLIRAGQIVVDSVTNLTLRELAWTTNGTCVVPEAGRTYSFADLYPRPGQLHLVDFNAARAAAHETALRAPPSTPTRQESVPRHNGSPGSSTMVETSSDYSWTDSSGPQNWKVGQRLRQPDGTWGPIIRPRLRRRRGTRTPSPTSSARREADNVGSNDEYDSQGLIPAEEESSSSEDSSSDSLEYACTEATDDSRNSDSSSSSSSCDSEDGAPPLAQRPRSEDNVPSSPPHPLVLTSSDDEAMHGPRDPSPIEVTDDESSVTPTVSRATSVIDLTTDTPERGRARIRLMSPIVLVDTPARGRRRRLFSPIDMTDDEGPPSNRRRLFSPIDMTNDEGSPSNRQRMPTVDLTSEEEGDPTTRAYISSDEEGQQSPPQWGDPPLDGASQQSADSDSDDQAGESRGDVWGSSEDSRSPEV
ncbi:hypothetical protein BD626DRAFT_572082 [Schizophyllum amplum]|uniref:Uncharacterized protein n=1 Tax=Schizophyllum amplum TaxID=97359 RepID=A0A550C586_9AGAR|nr:hypothetical protein BD626DRAFT_572082 [Auriculariopsis ampla]